MYNYIQYQVFLKYKWHLYLNSLSSNNKAIKIPYRKYCKNQVIKETSNRYQECNKNLENCEKRKRKIFWRRTQHINRESYYYDKFLQDFFTNAARFNNETMRHQCKMKCSTWLYHSLKLSQIQIVVHNSNLNKKYNKLCKIKT